MPDVVRELVAKLGYEVDSSGLDEWNAGTDSAAKATGEFSEGISESEVATIALGSALGAGITKVAEMGAEAAIAAGKFAVELVTGFADFGDEVAKTSGKLDVNVESLQRLRFATERSGGSTAALDKSIKQLQLGLVDARDKGTGPAIEGLDLLGLTLADLEDLDVEQQFGLIADSMNELESSADKTAAAAKLLGSRAGVDLKVLLKQGSEGITALGDRAEELGGVLSEDAAMGAENLADSFLDLDVLSTGLKNKIGQALAPAVTDAINGFTQWIAENDQLIRQDLPEFLGLVIDAAREFLPVLIEVFVETKNLFTQIRQLDERLTEDLGPAWGIIKGAIEATISPITFIIGLIDDVIDGIDELADSAGVIGDVAKGLQGLLPGGSQDTGAGTRGLGAGQIQTSGTGGPEATAAAAQASTDKRQLAGIGPNTKAAALTATIENPNTSAAVKAKAAAFLPVAAAAEATAAASKNAEANAAKAAATERRRLNREAAKATNAAKAAKARGAGKGGGGKKKKGKDEPTIDELIGGGGKSSAGGGASPLAGAQITRIDASFNAPTEINVSLPPGALEGLSNADQATLVGNAVADALGRQRREAFDHYQGAVRP